MSFLTIFLLTIPNATAQTIGVISAIGQVCGFLFEIPSGYLSDKIGHKNAIVLAKTSFALSVACYIFANSIIYFIFGAIFLALGIAMNSGTTSAFLKESLDDIGRGHQYSSISGKLRSVGFAVPIVLILLVAFVAEKNYQLAFAIVLVTDIIGIITALSLTPVKKEQTIDEFDIHNSGNLLKSYFKIKWLPYVIFAELIFAISFAATAGFKNPFQESIGFSIGMIGVLWAISRIGISLLLLVNGWLKERINFKQLILIQGIGYGLILVGVGLSTNKWVIAILFILATIIRWGLSSIKSHFYLEYIHDSKQKASLLSMNSFIEKIFTGVFALVMGYIVFASGFAFGFMIAGIVISVVTLIAFGILKNKKPA